MPAPTPLISSIGYKIADNTWVPINTKLIIYVIFIVFSDVDFRIRTKQITGNANAIRYFNIFETIICPA